MRPPRRRAILAPLLVALAAAVSTACEPGTLFSAGPDSVEQKVPDGTITVAEARYLLPKLPVTPGGSLAGYDRDCGPGHACVFGPAWSDDVDVAGGHNGCDTRNDILGRDLHLGQVDGQPVAKRYREPGTCVLVEGVLDDPYTGRAIHFTKEHAGDVQIDHVVALAAAWRAGASAWDQRTRTNFANDPRNLLVVDGSTNQSKGDATAEAWLPPNAAFHCEYARIVITVKGQYGLAVTVAEQLALKAALDRCAAPASG